MELMKVAWIRKEGYPVGHPAPGRLNCPCGNAPESQLKREQGNVTCKCGREYTYNGWLIKEAPNENR